MATVITAGVAVIDFVFKLDEMPRRAEKHRAREATISGGGNAANASVAIARLGGKVMLATRLGDDPVGDMIVGQLEAEGVDQRFVRRFPGKQSSFSSVFIDAAGERQIVNFRDMDIDFGGSWLEEADIPPFDAALADTRWPQGAATLMRIARNAGKPGIIDVEAPASDGTEALRHASHAAFSMQGLTDMTGADEPQAGLAAAQLHFGGFLCVTTGEDGVHWRKGNETGHVAGFAVKPVDTLGAGDVWHGAFALALGEGRAEPDAMRFANAAAAIKCTRFGGRNGAPTLAETEAFLKERA